MNRRIIASIGAVVVCAASVSHASASVTYYTDRTTFINAVANLPGSPVTYTENFNTFTADSATFYAEPMAFNGFTASAFGYESGDINRVEVSPFYPTNDPGKQAYDNTPFLLGQHQTSGNATYYQLDFMYPTIAWGADVADVEYDSTNLQLSTGEVLDLAAKGAKSKQFIGVISDTPFFSVQGIGGGIGDSVGLDNIITVALPEPGSLAIGLIAGTGLLLRRRPASSPKIF